VTILPRSFRLAPSCSEIRPAPEARDSRIVALRTAIAEGRYRVDPVAVANKLLIATYSRTALLRTSLFDPLH